MRKAGLGLLLLMAACGDDPFDGTFEATYMGRSATFQLDEEDGRLSGSVVYSGVEGKVDGTVDGESAEGTVTVSSIGVVTLSTVTTQPSAKGVA